MPGLTVYLQDGGEIRDELKCSYCKLVMRDPVQTNKTGHRFCRECFYTAQKDANYTFGLYPNDQAWSDSIVKKEIAKLKVKCDNYMLGCAWEGFLKELMKHLSTCQFATMEPSQQNVHSQRCLQRPVQSFVELQEQTSILCDKCKKTMPTSQHSRHVCSECQVDRPSPLVEVNSDHSEVATYQQSITPQYKNPRKVTSLQEEVQTCSNGTVSVAPSRPRHSHQVVTHSPQVNNFSLQAQQREGVVDKNQSVTTQDVSFFRISVNKLYECQEDQQPHQLAPIQLRHVAVLKPLKPFSTMQHKSLGLDRSLGLCSVRDSERQLQASGIFSFDWYIFEVSQKIRDAKSGLITSIDSPPFYTGRNGYKMCIRAYLNGDGAAFFSLFVVIMKGDHDSLLKWPFVCRVSLILVDQDHKKHLVRSFTPDPQSSSFKKPTTDINVASGCPQFADLSVLHNSSYVREDVMHINAKIDISNIFL